MKYLTWSLQSLNQTHSTKENTLRNDFFSNKDTFYFSVRIEFCLQVMNELVYCLLIFSMSVEFYAGPLVLILRYFSKLASLLNAILNPYHL